MRTTTWWAASRCTGSASCRAAASSSTTRGSDSKCCAAIAGACTRSKSRGCRRRRPSNRTGRAVREYLLAALAGALLPLAFAPFGLFFLAPLSYAALLYLWGGATPWRAARIGFVFGCAAFGFGTYWTYIAVRIIGGAPLLV